MKTYLSIILILLSTLAMAQNKQYLQIKGHAGNSSLVYPFDGASMQEGNGGGASLSYHYFFNKNWGIGAGFGLSKAKTTSYLDSYTNVTKNFTDNEGDNYDSHLFLSNWEENQNVNLYEIPLTASYQHDLPIVEGLKLYIDAGFSLQMPGKSTYEVTQGVFENQGYYSQWNVTLSEVPGYFEKNDEYHPTGDINLKPCVSAIANIGLGYVINKNLECFAGLNMGYSLGNMQDGESQLIAMSEDQVKSYNGMINSTNSKVKAKRIGLEVGVRINLFNNKKASHIEENTQTIAVMNNDSIAKAYQDSLIQAEKELAELEEQKQLLIMDSIATTEKKQQLHDSLEAIKTVETDIDTNEIITLCHINFGKGASNLDFESIDGLSEIIALSNENPDMKIIIEGHTSSEGSEAANLIYGKQRADKVASYLNTKCNPKHPIEVISYGESRPIETNDTEEGRNKNRRAEVKVKY